MRRRAGQRVPRTAGGLPGEPFVCYLPRRVRLGSGATTGVSRAPACSHDPRRRRPADPRHHGRVLRRGAESRRGRRPLPLRARRPRPELVDGHPGLARAVPAARRRRPSRAEPTDDPPSVGRFQRHPPSAAHAPPRRPGRGRSGPRSRASTTRATASSRRVRSPSCRSAPSMPTSARPSPRGRFGARTRCALRTAATGRRRSRSRGSDRAARITFDIQPPRLSLGPGEPPSSRSACRPAARGSIGGTGDPTVRDATSEPPPSTPRRSALPGTLEKSAIIPVRAPGGHRDPRRPRPRPPSPSGPRSSVRRRPPSRRPTPRSPSADADHHHAGADRHRRPRAVSRRRARRRRRRPSPSADRTPLPAGSPIDVAYAALGGAGSFLGAPSAATRALADGGKLPARSPTGRSTSRRAQTAAFALISPVARLLADRSAPDDRLARLPVDESPSPNPNGDGSWSATFQHGQASWTPRDGRLELRRRGLLVIIFRPSLPVFLIEPLPARPSECPGGREPAAAPAAYLGASP